MNKLRQMSIFAHIVEQGSVSAAAEKLGLSKSVVSQHLKKLEQELGSSLLKRTTRRQTLTPMG
ncbi:LysR family transcriptional regulator, partial [Vibrio fortis]